MIDPPESAKKAVNPSSTVLILYASVELAERTYEAEPLWLPPKALGRRTRFLAGTESGSLKAGDFKGCRALRFYENCAGKLVSSTIPTTR